MGNNLRAVGNTIALCLLLGQKGIIFVITTWVIRALHLIALKISKDYGVKEQKMSGLFKSLSNLFRWKKKGLVKSLADPIRDGYLAIEDAEKMVVNFSGKLAEIMAGNKQLQREQKTAEGNVSKYQAIAEKAAIAAEEDDARLALEMKASAKKLIGTLEEEISRNAIVIAQLKDQLTKANARVSEAKRNMLNLEARYLGAGMRKGIAKTSSDFGSGGPLQSLDDLDKAVNATEAEAEAWEELNHESGKASGDSLAEKYSVKSTEVEDELALLLAKNAKPKTAE